MENETRARIEKDCKNALQCLYIAVEESVAQDVDNKVSAYVHLLKNEHSRITELLKEERNKAIDECIDSVLDKSTEADRFIKFSYQEIKIILESLKGKQQ